MLIVFGAFLSIFVAGGRCIDMEARLEVYEMLHNVVGTLFGVFGLWVGVIYPKALQELISPKKKHSATVLEVQLLIRPLILSLGLFFFILVLRGALPFVEPWIPTVFLCSMLDVLLAILFTVLVYIFRYALGQLVQLLFNIVRKATENEMDATRILDNEFRVSSSEKE